MISGKLPSLSYFNQIQSRVGTCLLCSFTKAQTTEVMVLYSYSSHGITDHS